MSSIPRTKWSAEAALTRLLEGWLAAVPADPSLKCRAVIAPYVPADRCHAHSLQACGDSLSAQACRPCVLRALSWPTAIATWMLRLRETLHAAWS